MERIPVFENLKVDECTGCEACAAICPVNCISFEENEEGFLYPFIKNSNCVRCNKCNKICPALNYKNKCGQSIPQEVYAGFALHKDVVFNSASGGAFSLIVSHFIHDHINNYKICGVIWDKKFHYPIHKLTSDLSVINEMRGSKYIQSSLNCGQVYCDIKEELDHGIFVLFSGTPCQVAGLHNYLDKKYENLFTVDIVCQGPTSRKVMREYVAEMENQYKSGIKHINMRFVNMPPWIPQWINIKFENGKEYCHLFYETIIGRAVHILQRKSCYNCKFTSDNHYSDITIGDYHGADKHAAYYNAYGTSIVLVNTSNGIRLFESIDKDDGLFIKQDYALVCKSNPRIFRSWKPDVKRGKFSADLISSGLHYAAYHSWSLKERIKFHIPYKIRLAIWKCKEKI